VVGGGGREGAGGVSLLEGEKGRGDEVGFVRWGKSDMRRFGERFRE
jgi:hypothetical protein